MSETQSSTGDGGGGGDNTGSRNPNATTSAIPLLNTYIVRRERLDGGGIEEITVKAHLSGTNTSNVLRFVEIGHDPVVGLREYIVRSFNDWIDYEEVYDRPNNDLIVDPRSASSLYTGGSESIN